MRKLHSIAVGMVLALSACASPTAEQLLAEQISNDKSLQQVDSMARDQRRKRIFTDMGTRHEHFH